MDLIKALLPLGFAALVAYVLIRLGYRLVDKIFQPLEQQTELQFTQQQTVQGFNDFERDYTRFGNAVKDCLVSVYWKCGLKRPRDIKDIFCAEVSDRVYCKGSIITFCYEFACEEVTGTISNGEYHAKYIDYGKIIASVKEELQKNMAAYLRGRYIFSDLDGFEISGNRIRFEFIGVLPINVII